MSTSFSSFHLIRYEMVLKLLPLEIKTDKQVLEVLTFGTFLQIGYILRQ